MAAKQTLVCDNGTGSIKAGFSSDNAPMVLPTNVGRLPFPTTVCVGDEVVYIKSFHSFRYPMERGTVTNWGDMEKIWEHAFRRLAFDPEEHNLLLTETVVHRRPNRVLMGQIMFETFNVGAMCFQIPALLSLYANNRVTGCVVDCGEGVTNVLPVWEGRVFTENMQNLNIGGRDVTNLMMKLLKERNIDVHSENARHIKENLAYVAPDREEHLQTAAVEKKYELPDGQIIQIGPERFRCAEFLFNRSLYGWNAVGVHEVTHNTIMKCENDIQSILYKNIILSGGSTMFPGFAERMTKEIRHLGPAGVDVEVVTPEDRINSAWKGGCVLASVSTFNEEMLISKADYNEKGLVVLHEKD